MASALISLCVTALVVCTVAEQPGTNSYGGSQVPYATPGSQGVRYAGPIVYTNEKPPVIHFPPPPAHAKIHGFGGGGGFGKSQSIKYVPMPHHDLPVLIYQSDISPPIHVVHPGQGQVTPTKAQSQTTDFGSLKDYTSSSSAPQQVTYSPIAPPKQQSYEQILTDYSTQSKTVYRPQQSHSHNTNTQTHSQSQRPSTNQRPSNNQRPSQSYQRPYKQQQPYITQYKTYNQGSFEYISPPKNQYHRSRPPMKTDIFGSGSAPAPQYTEYIPESKPKNDNSKKSSPLPHIIYAGHPPIHLFQSPPIYMVAPKGHKQSYSTSTKTAYRPGPIKSAEFLYTSESSPPRTIYGPPKPTFGPVQKQKTEYRSSPKPDYRPSGNADYRTSVKPTYRPSGSSDYRTSMKPTYHPSGSSDYRTSVKPTYRPSGNPDYRTSAKPDYRDRQPTTASKTEYYGRQKAEYSSPSAVFVKPQHDFMSSSVVYGPTKSEQPYRSQNSIWGSQSFSSFGSPIKYKTTKQVTYSPAPKSWHKPPIIIYQGVKPPVHMFENAVPFDPISGATTGSGIPANYASRRISNEGNGGLDPSANNVEFMNTGSSSTETRYQNPTMWIPAYGLQTQNGYQTTLYVSDLTQAGAVQQLFPTLAPTPTLSPVGASEVETQTVPVPNPDGTQTTSQVKITATPADEVKGMTVSESSFSPITADQTSSAEPHIDSIPNAFLAAAGVNNQNTPLNSIPMSYASVVVQAAGSRPHRVN